MDILIDKQVVAIFLAKDIDSQEVEDYMQKYGEKVSSITSSVILEKLRNAGMSNEEMEIELEKLRQLGPEIPAFIDIDVMNTISNQINELHEQVYKYYEGVLNEEQKRSLNRYLDEKERQEDRTMSSLGEGLLAELDEIEDEFKRTGKIMTSEEKNQLNSQSDLDEDSAIPSESVDHNVSNPLVDPILED